METVLCLIAFRISTVSTSRLLSMKEHFRITSNAIAMSPIQPQRDSVVSQDQNAQLNKNTFQPYESLMARDLCAGCIVWLPGHASGVESVKCILPHNPCKNPELDNPAYEHYVVILDVSQQSDGQIKCYICLLTSHEGTDRTRHLDKRIKVKGFSSQPSFEQEHVYIEEGSMPKTSYIRVSHAFEISFLLLEPFWKGRHAYFRRLTRQSYFQLMQEIPLKAGIYEDTEYVIQFGATIRTDSKLSLSGSSSDNIGIRLPDSGSSKVTSSSASTQDLTIIAPPNTPTVSNSSNCQNGTILSALRSSTIHPAISTSPARGSIIEQHSDDHRNLHTSFQSPLQPESSDMVLLNSQPVPSNSTTLTDPNLKPSHPSSQLLQLSPSRPLDLQKALTFISSPLSRFPRYLLEAILFIGKQPWGKLCLYSLVLLACYHTGTLKFGFLAIKGLDGWLATLGNWSAPRYFNVVRVLGGLIKVWGRLASPMLLRVVKVVGGLLKDVGLWVIRKIGRRS